MRRDKARGLSLFELVVAMSLLVMVLGFGAVNLRQSKSQASTRAVAESLAEALRQTREEAIKERTACALVIPSAGGSKPHSQAYYRLRGDQHPRLLATRQWQGEFPDVLLFVGHWSLASASNTAIAPSLGAFKAPDFSQWQPPHPADHHFIFTPQGQVITNSKVLYDQAYHIVVCQGAEYTPEQVPPAQSFRASKLGQPCTVSISLLGDITVSLGIPGAATGVAVPSAAWPDAPAEPPPLEPVANVPPTVSALVVNPKPHPPTLPAGVDATVDLRGYLTITTRAQDANGGPLRCVWMAQDGAVSSSFETPMEWNGVDWVSVWEWRPPEAAIPGDRYELTCQVKDPAGAVVEDNFGAAGLVEVTGVGEIVFDSSRDGNREIFTMNADGSNLVNLTNHPAWDHMPCWSPDGSRIAFVSNRLGPQAIFVMYADGTGVKQVSAPSSGVSLPDWSPDGTRIVYSTNSLDPVPASYIVNADGSDLHPPIPALHVFTTSDDFIRNSWHPNGNLLCVNTRDDSVGVGTDIFTMQPDGSNVTNITNTAGFDSMPRWSPSGTRLVWNSDRAPHDGNHEIYVSEFDGVNLVAPQRITDNPNADVQPSWSPDSQKVLWVRKDGGPMSSTGDIYIADLDGSDVRQLTTHASLDDFPSWRP